MRRWRVAANRAPGCCATTSTNHTRSARASPLPRVVFGMASCIAGKVITPTPSIGSAASGIILFMKISPPLPLTNIGTPSRLWTLASKPFAMGEPRPNGVKSCSNWNGNGCSTIVIGRLPASDSRPLETRVQKPILENLDQVSRFAQMRSRD